jgi:predicted secreted Zn-dependent protease
MLRLLLPLLFLAAPARADIFDQADISVTTYLVSGSDLAEVQDQMGEKGPRGSWAYTTWNAAWDGDCQTAVTAEITMPELAEDADLTAAQVAEFDRMTQALLSHELGHVQIGLDFAAAVQAAGCPADTTRLHDDFAAQELDYDATTQHGYTQGATLEEP